MPTMGNCCTDCGGADRIVAYAGAAFYGWSDFLFYETNFDGIYYPSTPWGAQNMYLMPTTRYLKFTEVWDWVYDPAAFAPDPAPADGSRTYITELSRKMGGTSRQTIVDSSGGVLYDLSLTDEGVLTVKDNTTPDPYSYHARDSGLTLTTESKTETEWVQTYTDGVSVWLTVTMTLENDWDIVECKADAAALAYYANADHEVQLTIPDTDGLYVPGEVVWFGLDPEGGATPKRQVKGIFIVSARGPSLVRAVESYPAPYSGGVAIGLNNWTGGEVVADFSNWFSRLDAVDSGLSLSMNIAYAAQGQYRAGADIYRIDRPYDAEFGVDDLPDVCGGLITSGTTIVFPVPVDQTTGGVWPKACP